MPIPAHDSISEPLLEGLNIDGMLPVQRRPLMIRWNDSASTLATSQRWAPRARGCPARRTTHETVALMPRQIAQNEHHQHRWEKRASWIDIPFLFAFEPGMQDRIGAVLHCFRAHLSGRGSKRGGQFGLRVPGRAGLQDALRLPGIAQLVIHLIASLHHFPNGSKGPNIQKWIPFEKNQICSAVSLNHT